MRARTRMAVSTLALAALAGGALAYAYYGVAVPKKAKEKQKEVASHLLPQKLDDVVEVTVQQKKKTPVVMKKTGLDDWSIVSPIQATADASTVHTIIDRLMGMTRKKKVVDGKDAAPVLGKYGLDAPSLMITLKTAKATHVVRLGDQNPFDREIYERADDGDIGLVAASVRYPIDKGLFDLREKRVLRFDDNKVKSVSVKLADQSYTLTRVGANGWQVSGLATGPADPAAARGVLTALTEVRAVAFPKGAPADFGLDAPSATVDLELEGGKKISLTMGHEKKNGVDRWYAEGSQIQGIAQIPSDTPTRLEKKPFDLRYKNIVHFDRAKVARLDVHTRQGTFTVTRLPGAKTTADGGYSATTRWAVSKPKKAPAKRWEIASSLYALMDLKGSAIVVEHLTDRSRLADYGLASPEATYTVYDEKGKVLGELLLGKKPSPGSPARYAANASLDRIFLVPVNRVKGLPYKLSQVEETPAEASAK